MRNRNRRKSLPARRLLYCAIAYSYGEERSVAMALLLSRLRGLRTRLSGGLRSPKVLRSCGWGDHVMRALTQNLRMRGLAHDECLHLPA